MAILSGCKNEPTCSPGDITWRLQIAIQASTLSNPGPQGSLPTVVRIFQLEEPPPSAVDFREFWTPDADVVKGVVDQDEFEVFPGKTVTKVIEPAVSAKQILVAALFREPLGNTWMETYEIPWGHAEAVCAGRRSEPPQALADPCLLVLLDRNQVNAGATAPPGFSMPTGMTCAPPASAYPRMPPDQGRKKKRKKKDGKKAGEVLKKGSEIDPQAQPPQAPQPETPQAPEVPLDAPEAPSAPQPPGLVP